MSIHRTTCSSIPISTEDLHTLSGVKNKLTDHAALSSQLD